MAAYEAEYDELLAFALINEEFIVELANTAEIVNTAAKILAAFFELLFLSCVIKNDPFQ